MPADDERYLPPLVRLFFLPSLLLIACLDGAMGAAEEGGGLPSYPPGDNGLAGLGGSYGTADTTGPSALVAGKQTEMGLSWGRHCLGKMEMSCRE